MTPGDVAVIAGPGAIGLLTLQVVKAAGATAIVLGTDMDENRLALASSLGADAVINIPKLKTHKKSGVTLALKSCIGLTNEKYWLPHYTEGSPAGRALNRLCTQ